MCTESKWKLKKQEKKALVTQNTQPYAFRVSPGSKELNIEAQILHA
jgi:hypothetical protein